MAKYKSKPVEVDAVQWFPGVEHPGVYKYATKSKIVTEEPLVLEPVEWSYSVTTMHDQHVTLTPGDWIIAEPVPDRYYPCKPEVFAKRYEAA